MNRIVLHGLVMSMIAWLASCSTQGEDHVEVETILPATPTDANPDSASNLFYPIEGQDALLSSEPTIMRGRVVTIDFSLLDVSKGDSELPESMSTPLGLNLFEGVFYTAILERQETDVNGVTTWTGHIEGIEFTEVTISVSDNVMSGSISLPGGEIYSIQFLSGTYHAVYQIDQSAFPPEEPIED